MARPFNFSAWTKFQDQPLAHPGKIYDRADNEGVSVCPVGGPIPYGRVIVRGPQAGLPGVPAQALSARYYTKIDAGCLPDKNGAYLKTNEAVPRTFAAAGLTLPLDDDGLLIPLGIGMWTEHGFPDLAKLAQPFGLGDTFYQPEYDGQAGLATDGRIWTYCETAMNVGDKVYFRTEAAGATLTNGVGLLGAVLSVAGTTTQLLPQAKVMRPGPAGGACVLQIKF